MHKFQPVRLRLYSTTGLFLGHTKLRLSDWVETWVTSQALCLPLPHLGTINAINFVHLNLQFFHTFATVSPVMMKRLNCYSNRMNFLMTHLKCLNLMLWCCPRSSSDSAASLFTQWRFRPLRTCWCSVCFLSTPSCTVTAFERHYFVCGSFKMRQSSNFSIIWKGIGTNNCLQQVQWATEWTACWEVLLLGTICSR